MEFKQIHFIKYHNVYILCAYPNLYASQSRFLILVYE